MTTDLIPLAAVQKLTEELGGELETSCYQSQGTLTFRLSQELTLTISFTTIIEHNGDYFYSHGLSAMTGLKPTHVRFSQNPYRTQYHLRGKGARDVHNWEFADQLMEALSNAR